MSSANHNGPWTRTYGNTTVDVHLAILKSMYTRNYVIKVASVHEGILMAHIPQVLGMVSGHVTVHLKAVPEGTEVDVHMDVYEAQNRNEEVLNGIVEDLFDSIELFLDTDWSEGSTVVSPSNGNKVKEKLYLTPPPVHLQPPDMGRAVLLGFGAIMSVLVYVDLVFILFPKGLVGFLWPYLMLTPLLPAAGVVLMAMGRWREAWYLFVGGGMIMSMVLLFPTLFTSIFLIFPFSMTGKECCENMYWLETYEQVAVKNETAAPT